MIWCSYTCAVFVPSFSCSRAHDDAIGLVARKERAAEAQRASPEASSRRASAEPAPMTVLAAFLG